MKIALLGPAHPFRGGIVHFNSRLAVALKNRPELEVNLYYWSKVYPAFLLPGSALARLDNHSSLTFHQPGLRVLSYTNPLTWASLTGHLLRGRYDLFITHWVHPVHYPVFKCLFAAMRLLTKTKICLIVHNTLPHEPFPGDLEMTRSVFKMAHRLILHGKSEVQQAIDMKLPSDNIITAFHPIFDQFTGTFESQESIRQHLGLRKKVLLFFGFIRPYKGLEHLIEAFSALASRYPDVSLLIVGEHFMREKQEAAAQVKLLSHLSPDDPVRAQIVWIDRYIPNEEVGRYFLAADVLIVPYLSVTQSGPLQVAYAFDKPVIASNLPAFQECVEVGQSGYLFLTGSVSDLSKKIELFLNKPVSAEQVRRFRQKFSWESYVDRMLDSLKTGTG